MAPLKTFVAALSVSAACGFAPAPAVSRQATQLQEVSLVIRENPIIFVGNVHIYLRVLVCL